MPQLHLPMFPAGVTHITSELAFEQRDGDIVYFNAHMAIFTHKATDVATFRQITSQFCESGYAKQSDIARAFGVTLISVKRAVKLYREKGNKGFFAPRLTRGAAVLVESVMAQVEELLAGGASEAEVATRLGLKRNTLQKAIRAGRIRMPAKKRIRRRAGQLRRCRRDGSGEHEERAGGSGLRGTDGSRRDRAGGTDGGERGRSLTEASPRFEPALDVAKGDVLLALPALSACRLLRHSEKYFNSMVP